MADGWKVHDIDALSVGQWWGLMQKDGPGSEEVIDHPDEDSLTRTRNDIRKKKGLPLLSLPSERAQSEGKGMKDEEIKVGARVSTPHGPATVDSRNEEHGGWLVKRDRDNLLAFYHAWDMHPHNPPEVQTPAV